MTQPSARTTAVAFFLRHLVALTIKVRLPDGSEHADAFTCFVMEVRGQWFLATAGHIIKGLEDALGEERFTILEWGLFDGWNAGASGNTQVPFNFRDAARFYIDDDAAGLDLGVISVPSMVRMTLERNGIVAFDAKTWRNVPDDLDHYFILGMPSEFIDPALSQGVLQHLKVEPVVVPIEKCEPPVEMQTEFTRFFGKLAPTLTDETGEVLRDMKGMSGGPIIGLRELDSGAAYFLVAIQGSWRPDLRVVAGAHAVALGVALEVELELAAP